ncbi:MAG TPA: CPBP family intramembrane glutamic endopeptidase [bacterium]
MALTVGIFEAVFFRGFVQSRLEAAFGPGRAGLGSAALYAIYRVWLAYRSERRRARPVTPRASVAA